MAFWPALLLARSERLPWGLRGVLAGGAVLLAEVALLSQSRGSLYATPVMLVLVFALLPGRVRTFAVLVPVAAGIGVGGAGGAARGRPSEERPRPALGESTALPTAMFAAALVVGLVVAMRRGDRAAASLLAEHRRSACPRRRGGDRRSPRSWRSSRAVWWPPGNPVTRIEHGWHTFKVGYAPTAPAAVGC